MPIELTDFYDEFFQEIQGLADADGLYAEDSFFDLFCDYLVDAGELDTADRAQYLSPRGLRIDGYGGDPLTHNNVLSLIIADYNQSPEVATLTATEMDTIFKRANRFLANALNTDFRNRLEETSPAFGLADLINSRWSSIAKVRILLISNRVLSARVDGREAGEFEGVPVTYSVWDLGRLHRFAISGREREELDIDLEADFGGPVMVLPAHIDSAGYEAYLAVMPGRQLAEIYEKWGARLLEQNVRCFLQARSNVNKGIRNTIQNEPQKFFAYNNGITATAESIETKTSEQGILLTRLKNFQIVNGGQTTASIHAANQKMKNDLDRVFVQMKLSIVSSEDAAEMVPKISEYANSQNRVNAADFFSNHPYHVRIEEFSRRIYAPSPDGTFRQSKWFYERARGQYQDARAYLSPAERKRFDLEYPKKQMFSKTDLAKFLNLWLGNPDIVSKGAQKNFVNFANAVGQLWEKNSNQFNEDYFRHSIAKAIVFRHVEKLVTAQPWYEGGYRANVVAYTISKLAYDVERAKKSIDFDAIWTRQAVGSEMNKALSVTAKAVHDVIVDPDPGIRNVTEWAKKQACWARVKSLNIDLPSSFWKKVISKDEQKQRARSAARDQRMLNGIEAQLAVVNAEANLWQEVLDWGDSHNVLTRSEASVLKVAASYPKKVPTEKQCIKIIQTLRRLRLEGCPIGHNIA